MSWNRSSWQGGGGGGKGGYGGGGKAGPPQVNYNVPGINNASIEGIPNAGVAVFQGDPDQGVEFAERLREALDGYAEGEANFENIDVSKVAWDPIAFSVLLDVLSEKAIRTKRFKAYKCGLDDDALVSIASWFALLPADGLPQEIHLSHNRLSQRGFDEIFNMIESKRTELDRHANPVWLRVENNDVEADYINALEQEGRVMYCEKIQDCRRGQSEASVAMPRQVGRSSHHQSDKQWPAVESHPASQGKGSGKSNMPTVSKAASPAKGNAKGGRKGSSQGAEMRVHPSDKDKKPYTYEGFLEFNNGDQRKADRMWNESKPAPKQEANEETRVHPSDKEKKPYTYAGFIEFAQGDEKKAQRMWNESKPAPGSAPSKEAPWKDDNKQNWKQNSSNNNGWKNKQSAARHDDAGGEDPMEEFHKEHSTKSFSPMTQSSKAAPAQPRLQQTAKAGAPAQQKRPAAGATPAAKRAKASSPAAAVRQEPKSPPKSKEEPLPDGWEESFSEEFKIPFYWHGATETSSWERPTGPP